MSQFLVKVFAILSLTWLNLDNTPFTLTKEQLVLTEEQFTHTKSL